MTRKLISVLLCVMMLLISGCQKEPDMEVHQGEQQQAEIADFDYEQYLVSGVESYKSSGRNNGTVTEGKLPIIVGGTGLYIKALLYDYAFTKIDTELNEYEDEDTEELYQRLLKLDPKATEVIHPNNRRRIVRALQMAESGNLKSEQEAEQKHEMIYDAKIIGLTMDRTLLKERINKRVDLMFEAGLLDEVNKLNEKYDWDMHGLHGIGYKEFKDYFLGNMTLEETR